MKTVRCAIYTRKSSDEGLEQSFNSLDAQREACAAYILSQASEGWTLVPEIYDDGGISGGTLERPALQRLLGDIAEGRIDIIVVYKVDRLTRSLLDFAKLVEALDKAGVSFVSITQSFNTTTSMGRLTLNMLLSFAQFEREVTAERIRDKIAASKAKGMWMGGVPPLGYRGDGRSLAIVEEHAGLVRGMFRDYLRLGSVRLLEEQLLRQRIRVPVRTLTSGRTIGGGAFHRGQLYTILKNRVYIAEIAHNGAVHQTLSKPLIARAQWEEVQALLARHTQGRRSGARAPNSSLLSGKVFDEAGKPLLTAHACKGKVRYRYYVSRALHTGQEEQGMRVPARELESAVAGRIAELLQDPLALAEEPSLYVLSGDYPRFIAACTELAARLGRIDRTAITELVERVELAPAGLSVTCSTDALARALGCEIAEDAAETIALTSPVRLTRTGRVMRLVDDKGAAAAPSSDTSPIRLVVQARKLWAELAKGELDIKRLAVREGLTASYITRVVRLAFLSPAVVEAVQVGTLRAGVDGAVLTASGTVPASWAAQAERYLPATRAS